MKKVSMSKLALLAGLFLVLLAACKKDDNTGSTYDAAGQYTKDSILIRDYLAANNLTATLDSTGIFYSVVTPGNGVDSLKFNGSKFKSLYTGRLLNGTVFDSTGTTARQFTYNQVIIGWRIAVTKITKGGKIKMYLPSYFAYGPEVNSGIPANSVLIFDMEMTDIDNTVQ
jgi:FKBP-type peptidyl-prolyl cis-trans isomerase